MGSRKTKRGVKKRANEWATFLDALRTNTRPDTFDEIYAHINNHVYGLYEDESRALWNILKKEEIRSVAEVGRHLGANLFMIACCCRELEYVYSTDIFDYDPGDTVLKNWFTANNICSIISVIEPDEVIENPDGIMFDFVFIDGGHKAESAARDIESWKDHARLIGFHDYADKKTNRHGRYHGGLVEVITKAANEYGWEQTGERGRSEIVYRTEYYGQ